MSNFCPNTFQVVFGDISNSVTLYSCLAAITVEQTLNALNPQYIQVKNAAIIIITPQTTYLLK
jgi:hypothetical protein